MYAALRRNVRFFWYRTDKAPVVFVVFAAAVIGALALTLRAVFAYQDELRERVRAMQGRELACLARNVYFEARGEPVAGQYAVAEVTMNRKASRLFPRTVCDVVYQKSWDSARKRYVGAFSWTEFKTLPEPEGEEWDRARRVAEAVYYQKYAPQLHGALHYHAVYVKPDWAKGKQPVAKIGRHVFYK
jgi:spore germination cell wall hydrolase CwlJ-like protein